MEHLNTEILARLVDQTPQPEEAAHIAECEACSAELEAIRSQTDALRSLPEIRPPQGDWHGLEARLRSEGLMNDPGRFRRIGLAQTPGWMRAAAAAVLFLSGAGAGALLTSPEAPESLGDLAMPSSAKEIKGVCFLDLLWHRWLERGNMFSGSRPAIGCHSDGGRREFCSSFRQSPLVPRFERRLSCRVGRSLRQ